MASRAVKKVTEAQMLDDFIQNPVKLDRPETTKNSQNRPFRQWQQTQLTSADNLPPHVSSVKEIPRPKKITVRPNSATPSRMKKRTSVHNSNAFITAKQ